MVQVFRPMSLYMIADGPYSGPDLAQCSVSNVDLSCKAYYVSFREARCLTKNSFFSCHEFNVSISDIT